MKIMLVHNFYRQAGGEDAVLGMESSLLESKGHTVHRSELSNESISSMGLLGKATIAAQTIYSFESKARIREELIHIQPDIVHVHNTFPLWSPSIFYACSDLGIPVIQTLHNYRLVCAAATFYRDGRICTDCHKEGNSLPGIVHGCYRGSRSQTLIVAAMLHFHRMAGTWESKVSRFLALTDFQKRILIEAGVPGEKIVVKPNFVYPPGNLEHTAEASHALFVGRLSEEKGVDTLIHAYATSGIQGPLLIVGDGPLREGLTELVTSLGAEDRIFMLGRRSTSEVANLMRRAKFLAFPSECYEGMPLVILEAFANGLPVLSSKIGGLPEIVQEGYNGWLVAPGDVGEWVSGLRRASDVCTSGDDLRRNAYASWETKYSPDVNYRQLMEVYEHAKG